MQILVRNQDGTSEHISAHEGETLLQALQDAGKVIFAPCGGDGTCGRCKVLVRDEDGVGYKLACQTKAVEGIEILLEEISTVKIAGIEDGSLEDRSNDASYGIAIDVGSTTMVFHLVNLDARRVVASVGRVNPQVVFGSDVIARINAASKPGGLDDLCGCLSAGINESIEALCKRTRIAPESIVKLSIVGNTTMQHFVTGLDPHSIGISPFVPQSLFGEVCALYHASEQVIPEAYLAPAVAGYVGGDITAGILASRMADQDKLQLFIDIGTNGEMALGNKDRIVCCATAAGPAFEGASIKLGMPAMPGAVSMVRLGGAGLEIETVDGAAPVGICGSGLLDAVAALVEAELVDETGYLSDDEEVAPAWADWIGEVDGETVCFLDPDHNVYLAQSDIRKVQLAKSAIRAGIETMISEMGASYDDIDEVALAGGFGMHLDPHSATAIGLIPPALDGKVKAYGNTAGQGAVECLFDEGREATERIARDAEYLELSVDKRFNEFYIDYMGFDEE